MKNLAWLQVLLGVLIVAAVGYALYWSRTGLIDKLEGPAFATQTDASRWIAVHPSFVTFARWLMWPVGIFGIGVLGLGILQVTRYPNGNQSHPALFQMLAGFLVAVGTFVVLLAVKPNQFALSTGQGGLQLGYVHSLWSEPYAVITFIAILLGIAVMGVALLQYTIVNRKPAPAKSGRRSGR